MDREKVIKGLEKLRKDLGYGLPDRSDVVMEYLNSLTDAIALLKEQEEQIKKRDESLEKAREEIQWLRGMLKEQEPKTGRWIDSAGDYKCSVCMATYGDLYPDYQYTHYCPNCGAKMIIQEVKLE